MLPKVNIYEDVTDKWFKDVGNEKGIKTNQMYFIDYKGNKYIVNGTTVKMKHSKHENEIAHWYTKTKKKY